MHYVMRLIPKHQLSAVTTPTLQFTIPTPEKMSPLKIQEPIREAFKLWSIWCSLYYIPEATGWESGHTCWMIWGVTAICKSWTVWKNNMSPCSWRPWLNSHSDILVGSKSSERFKVWEIASMNTARNHFFTQIHTGAQHVLHLCHLSCHFLKIRNYSTGLQKRHEDVIGGTRAVSGRARPLWFTSV